MGIIRLSSALNVERVSAASAAAVNPVNAATGLQYVSASNSLVGSAAYGDVAKLLH